MTSSSAELPSQPDSLLQTESAASEPDAALEVERCLEELSQLAQSDLPPRDYYAALLDRVLRVLSALGAAAWHVAAGETKTLLSQVRFPRLLLNSQRRLALKDGQLVLPPFARAGARYPCDHPHPWPLVVASIAADANAQVVLEVALDPDAPPDVQQGAARLLGVIAEIAADYERRRELARLRERDARANRYTDLVMRLHAGLDLAATAYAIASDGRQWVGCDRVSVLQTGAGRAVTLAVSAADYVDRRSRQVAALEHLASVVAASGDALVWHETSTIELPPQLGTALQDYLDQSHARQLVVLPILPPVADDRASSNSRPAPLAILFAESFAAGQPLEALVERSRELAGASATALANALRHQSLPLLPLQERLAAIAARVRRQPALALVTLAFASLLVALLVVVPADFTVEAEGHLQPAVRRNLFAPSDAVVEEVLVEHGAEVAQGDVLLRLASPTLDLDQSRLSGELQTAQARISAVRTARSAPQQAAGADENQLASEEEQLNEQIAGLTRQLVIIDEWRRELIITSPLAGTVLTWNTHESLDARPVKQGQVLLSVAATTGPWNIELQVPDADAGHVLAAQRSSEGALPITFLLASDPAVTQRAELKRMAQATHATDAGSTAEAIALVDGPLPASARAGGRVTARIHCGRRSLGYVWLHDLVDFVRTTFWF